MIMQAPWREVLGPHANPIPHHWAFEVIYFQNKWAVNEFITWFFLHHFLASSYVKQAYIYCISWFEELFFEAISNFSQKQNIFWCRRGGRGVYESDSIDDFDHLKDDKGQEDKINRNRNEVTVSKNRDTGLL